MPKINDAANAGNRRKRSTRREIAARIAIARQAIGMSQADLAARFGVSRTAMSQYELGSAGVDSGDLEFLAEILHVPVGYLVGAGDPAPDKRTPEEELTEVFLLVKHLRDRAVRGELRWIPAGGRPLPGDDHHLPGGGPGDDGLGDKDSPRRKETDAGGD